MSFEPASSPTESAQRAAAPPHEQATPPTPWQSFLVALQFFTRLPVPQLSGFQPSWLHHSARYFPLVGWLVGAGAALALWLALWLWPPAVAAGLALALSMLITGCFHEDGLADSFDALGGAVSRERALQIMRDSRLGSYGTLALIVVIGLRWLTLAQLAALNAELAAVLLALSHPSARFFSGLVMARLPYVRDDDSKAKPVAQGLSGAALLWSALYGLLPCALLIGWWPEIAQLVLPALGAGLLVHVGCVRWFRRRLGGYTGDALGCTEQLAETAFLLAALAAWGLIT